MSAKRISDFLKFFQNFAPSSSVARVPCALGQKYCCIPAPTKAAEFEVKNRRKSAEEAIAKHLLLLLLFCFESN